jgi:hypothetical protein
MPALKEDGAVTTHYHRCRDLRLSEDHIPVMEAGRLEREEEVYGMGRVTAR